MRYLTFVVSFILVAVLAGLGLAYLTSPSHTLLSSLKTLLEQIALFGHIFEEEVWEMTPANLRAVLGILKCLSFLLMLWGSYAIWWLMRAVSREVYS